MHATVSNTLDYHRQSHPPFKSAYCIHDITVITKYIGEKQSSIIAYNRMISLVVVGGTDLDPSAEFFYTLAWITEFFQPTSGLAEKFTCTLENLANLLLIFNIMAEHFNRK